ncbi:hypothetical protein [Streptomyces cavernicola]|uniref:Serine/threonine protein kinase n=1 Tax=Streptomyces cavernicola TaxID=3043613 RepID=A0ABT6SE54_9ACTN|nr:hypothetical protein [Streptomyces sp. B-S-A6]MDI3406461.1 hypothetical protein [Streptomyces sp. B-S-A6]
MPEQPTPKRPPRTRTVIGACAVALSLAAAGALYVTGAFGPTGNSSDQARLPCDGIVPQQQAEQFLDARGVAMVDRIDRMDDEPQKCNLTPRKASKAAAYDELDVVVNRSASASSGDLLRELKRRQSDTAGYLVSPIGNGWRGVLATDESEARATLVMLCGDGDVSDSLSVNVTAWNPDNPGGPPTDGQRARFAQLAADTAANAAERADCKADPGRKIERVAAPIPDPLSSGSSEGATPAGAADGTCQGIDAPTRETEADPLAPIEDCLVLDETGAPSFRVAAYYGPFVEDGHVSTYKRGDAGLFEGPSGGADGVYWASADCPAQGGTAFFTSETLHLDEPLHHSCPTAPEGSPQETRTTLRRATRLLSTGVGRLILPWASAQGRFRHLHG